MHSFWFLALCMVVMIAASTSPLPIDAETGMIEVLLPAPDNRFDGYYYYTVELIGSALIAVLGMIAFILLLLMLQTERASH
jgi:hypothetical protein